MGRRSEILCSVWSWANSLALSRRTFCPALARYAADAILIAHSKPVAKFKEIVWLLSLRGVMPIPFSIPHCFLFFRPFTVSPVRVPHPLEVHRVKNDRASSVAFHFISSRHGNRRERQEHTRLTLRNLGACPSITTVPRHICRASKYAPVPGLATGGSCAE